MTEMKYRSSCTDCTDHTLTVFLSVWPNYEPNLIKYKLRDEEKVKISIGTKLDVLWPHFFSWVAQSIWVVNEENGMNLWFGCRVERTELV